MQNLDFFKKPKLHDIVKALGDCVAHAPEEDKAKLADAIERYAERFPKCYHRLHTENALLSEIFCELEETADARPGLCDQLKDVG